MSELVKEVALAPIKFAYSGEFRLIADPQTGIRKFVPRTFINTELIKHWALKQKMIPDLQVRVCPLVVLVDLHGKTELRLLQQFIDLRDGKDIAGFDINAEEWIKEVGYLARFHLYGMSHRIKDFKIFKNDDEIIFIFDEP